MCITSAWWPRSAGTLAALLSSRPLIATPSLPVRSNNFRSDLVFYITVGSVECLASHDNHRAENWFQPMGGCFSQPMGGSLGQPITVQFQDQLNSLLKKLYNYIIKEQIYFFRDKHINQTTFKESWLIYHLMSPWEYYLFADHFLSFAKLAIELLLRED